MKLMTFDDVTGENTIYNNTQSKQSHMPGHVYKIAIIEGS